MTANAQVSVEDAADASRLRMTFLVLSAGVVSFALMQSLATPVLPTIQHALHTSSATVTWVLTAYLVSASVFTPIIGRIGDLAGKNRMFVVTMGALALGALLAAIAPNIGVLIVARAIQGLGGGTMPLAFGIIRDEFPNHRVGSAVSILAGLTGVGAGLGVAIAGPLVSLLDYHWLFWVPMIFNGVAAVAAAFLIPPSRERKSGRISVLPALLLSAWLVALLIGLSEAPTWGWGSTRVIGLFVITVIAAPAWIFAEARAKTPVIDMRMMRLRPVWTTNAVALLVGIGMYTTFAFLPEFVQTPRSAGYGLGASVTMSGLIILPSSVASFISGMCYGRLVRSLGAKTVVVSACVVGAGSMALLVVAHNSTFDLMLVNALLGLGFGMAYSAMAALIVDAVPPDQTGVASGMNANIRTIGGALGASVMTSIVTAHISASSGLPPESGYTRGFLMLFGTQVLAIGAALSIPNLRRRVLGGTEEYVIHPEAALVAGGTVVDEIDLQSPMGTERR